VAIAACVACIGTVAAPGAEKKAVQTAAAAALQVISGHGTLSGPGGHQQPPLQGSAHAHCPDAKARSVLAACWPVLCLER